MNPIYPDKTKTGLAALKPLTDVFFAEPERWEWEIKSSDGPLPSYSPCHFGVVFRNAENGTASKFRLTPKPRRVWIGDESYPEPVKGFVIHDKWVCDLLRGAVRMAEQYTPDIIQLAARNGYLFDSERGAIQCLKAHQNVKRIE